MELIKKILVVFLIPLLVFAQDDDDLVPGSKPPKKVKTGQSKEQAPPAEKKERPKAEESKKEASKPSRPTPTELPPGVATGTKKKLNFPN